MRLKIWFREVLLHDAHHAVADDCVVVLIALLELLGHRARFILVALHLHDCIVEGGVEFLSDCLDGGDAEVLELLDQLTVDHLHAAGQRALFLFLRDGRQAALEVVDDGKHLLDDAALTH